MPLVDAVVLEAADHLEPRAVADVGEARVAVAAEVALVDQALFGAIEDRPPGLELVDAIGGLLSVQLGHAPLAEELAAAHRVAEVDLPAVALVGVGERGCRTTLGHDRVSLAEQRLADHAGVEALLGALDGRAQAGPAGSDDDDVVLDGLDLGDVHLRCPRC